MLSSLLAWGQAYRRWTSIGLKIPQGTTNVEAGFYANRLYMFDTPQTWLSIADFKRHAMVSALLLNYSLLHRWGEPDPRSRHPRVLALMDAAYERMNLACGLSGASSSQARDMFTKALLSNDGEHAAEFPDEPISQSQ